ncbi:MAG: phosphoribosylglycinamide formyltransferase [Burkholderiaceae bacterium]|jgi:phosphoribosylglycinamide formyltransferase-1|nr:phosphoribosylglycinamide formyltransferase [Burkholderiaceae bacterium]
MKAIVVVISGRGSNLEALIEAAARERWSIDPGAAIAGVVSNREDAAGLLAARRAGLATTVVDHRQFATRDAFDRALAAAIDAVNPELVVLAGFMRVLTPSFVQHYAGRLINIHPSLLPLFPGLQTHRQALGAGVRVHGATVHFVTEQVDCGGIIAQAVVPVLPGDDEAALAARVLAQEHRLLPRAVRMLLQRRVQWRDGRVLVDPDAAGELALFDATTLPGRRESLGAAVMAHGIVP